MLRQARHEGSFVWWPGHRSREEITAMPSDDGFIHPYVPNAAPAARRRMLAAIGIDRADAIYDAIPSDLRLRCALDLPPALPAEHSLRRHLEGILARNRHC